MTRTTKPDNVLTLKSIGDCRGQPVCHRFLLATLYAHDRGRVTRSPEERLTGNRANFT